MARINLLPLISKDTAGELELANIKLIGTASASPCLASLSYNNSAYRYNYRCGETLLQLALAHSSLKIDAAYPNPLNSPLREVLPFSSSIMGFVGLRVYDESGKTVWTDQLQIESQGAHFFYLPSESLISGKYFFTISNSKESRSSTFIVNK